MTQEFYPLRRRDPAEAVAIAAAKVVEMEIRAVCAEAENARLRQSLARIIPLALDVADFANVEERSELLRKAISDAQAVLEGQQ